MFVGSVEEKVEEIFASSLDNLLDKISMEVAPRYLLSGPLDAPALSTEDTPADEIPYPPMQVAALVIKLLRNSITCCADLNSLESKVVRTMRGYISTRMKSLGKPLEVIYNTRGASLSNKDTEKVESMLNLGHSSLAAVFAQWQIRYTLIGTQDTSDPNVKNKYIKDFLRPVRLNSPAAVLESIPKYLILFTYCS